MKQQYIVDVITPNVSKQALVYYKLQPLITDTLTTNWKVKLTIRQDSMQVTFLSKAENFGFMAKAMD